MRGNGFFGVVLRLVLEVFWWFLVRGSLCMLCYLQVELVFFAHFGEISGTLLWWFTFRIFASEG